MKKMCVFGALNLVSIILFAQDSSTADTHERSSLGYLIIGVLVLIVVIFMLYSRQKRKYND